MMRGVNRLTGLKLKTEHLIIGAAIALVAGLMIIGKDAHAYIAKVTPNSTQNNPEIIKLNSISGVSSIAAAGDFSTNSSSVAVANQMKKRQMVLPLGDYNYSSTHGSSYANSWFSKLWGNYNGYALPSIGNHDGGEASAYLQLFGIPGWSYSVDVGSIHILVLNTESPISGAAIDADLSAAKAKGKMLIVSHHIPLKGKTTSKDAYFWRDLPEWQAVFDKNKVELVLTGHSHFYARFKTSISPVGTTYLVVGTGGASIMNTTTNTNVAKLIKDYGYLRISISSGYLSCKFVDKNGSTKDTFNVYKKS